MCYQLRKWIFEETYGYPIEQLSAQTAAEIQRDVISIRTSYQHDVCLKRYATEAERNAYMITYYPTYIAPIDALLRVCLGKELLRKKELHLTYYAGGPCPELYGTLLALRSMGYRGRIEATIYDEQVGWEQQQALTKKLCEKEHLLWQGDDLHAVFGCDNGRDCKRCTGWVSYCRKESAKTDIFCMQNYLSHIRSVEEILPEMRARIRRSKPGAYFIICDLNYGISRKVLRELVETCSDADIVATNVYGAYEEKHCPYSLYGMEKIFTGADNLKAKTRTRYYYLVLRKQ